MRFSNCLLGGLLGHFVYGIQFAIAHGQAFTRGCEMVWNPAHLA